MLQVTSDSMVTSHMIHKKDIEYSGKDDVIQYVMTYVDLKVYTWSFRVG